MFTTTVRAYLIPCDHVNAEASKYIQFIIDHYESLHEYEWCIFTQAYPFDHSPDFIGLLEEHSSWKKPFQGLTYMAHPPKWGPWETLLQEKDKREFINGNRLWCEQNMDEKYQGDGWNDPWLYGMLNNKHLHTLTTFWNKMNNPYSLPDAKPKWYSACFAVTPSQILKYDKEFWMNLKK